MVAYVVYIPPFTLSAMLLQIDMVLKTVGVQPLFASFTLSAAGYIAPADAGDFGHLALALRRIAIESIPQDDHLPFLVRQAGVNGFPQMLHRFPGADLL